MNSHTVHIVSHKSDRASRKQLIKQFSELDTTPDSTAPSSMSTFELETTTGRITSIVLVRVIDCDYEEGMTIDSNTIVVVDTHRGSSAGKLAWMTRITGAAVGYVGYRFERATGADAWNLSWEAASQCTHGVTACGPIVQCTHGVTACGPIVQCTHGGRRLGMNDELTSPKLVLSRGDYEEIWFKYLRRKFGIADPIQTTLSMFEPMGACA